MPNKNEETFRQALRDEVLKFPGGARAYAIATGSNYWACLRYLRGLPVRHSTYESLGAAYRKYTGKEVPSNQGPPQRLKRGRPLNGAPHVERTVAAAPVREPSGMSKTLSVVTSDGTVAVSVRVSGMLIDSHGDYTAYLAKS